MTDHTLDIEELMEKDTITNSQMNPTSLTSDEKQKLRDALIKEKNIVDRLRAIPDTEIHDGLIRVKTFDAMTHVFVIFIKVIPLIIVSITMMNIAPKMGDGSTLYWIGLSILCLGVLVLIAFLMKGGESVHIDLKSSHFYKKLFGKEVKRIPFEEIMTVRANDTLGHYNCRKIQGENVYVEYSNPKNNAIKFLSLGFYPTEYEAYKTFDDLYTIIETTV